MNDSGVHESSLPRFQHSQHALFKRKSHINFPAIQSPIVPIHSSTLNDSLLASVESCNLISYTPNFYVEDDPAAGAASSTPDEFFKNHQECMQRTPIKHWSSTKLGSPERNEIINGRKPTSMTKWITPKAERSSPAKKRLFGLHHINGGITKSKSLLAQHTKHDPIAYFMKKRNVGVVIEKVFSYLRDTDLYNCKRVSRTWFEAVESLPAIRHTVNEYEIKLEVNKENPRQLGRLLGKSKSPLKVAPASIHSDKFIEVAQTLNENQSLTKCPCCQQPQIVEYNIGQCQNANCGYICCLKCNSFSCDGPEHFVDQCNGSALAYKKPKRRTLLDSPPHSQLSFLSSPIDNSHLYASSNKDSCYGTYDESQFGSSLNNSSPMLIGDDVGSDGKARKSLGESNRSETSSKRQTQRNSLYIPVVRLQFKGGRKTSPPSPERLGQRDEYAPYAKGDEYKGAGTVQSKKRLRRLLK